MSTHTANEIAEMFVGCVECVDKWLSVKQTAWLKGQFDREAIKEFGKAPGGTADGILSNGATWHLSVSPRNGAGLIKVMKSTASVSAEMQAEQAERAKMVAAYKTGLQEMINRGMPQDMIDMMAQSITRMEAGN